MFDSILLVQLDAFFERHQRAAASVDVGSEAWRAAEKPLRSCCARYTGIHLPAKRFELSEREVTGATLGSRILIGPSPGHAAFVVQVGGYDIGGRGQVALIVPAD